MRLCLGTVQLGVDYGICGGRRPSVEEAIRLLDYATQNGVDALDTAAAYGRAEEVVGEFLRRKTIPRNRLFITTKFGADVFTGSRPECWGAALETALSRSLDRLRTDYVDAFVCHVSGAATDEAMMEAMAKVKSTGRIRHVGVSVYEIEEACACLASPVCDFMQVPFSVLDQRMAREGVFAAAASRQMLVHARSPFVQGLALMRDAEIPDRLSAARPVVRALEDLCRTFGVTRRALALAYVRRQQAVSHLVFGVDGMDQLRENLASFSVSVPEEALTAAERQFGDVDPALVMPNKWRLT